jgi:excisionase family DNA binding protein
MGTQAQPVSAPTRMESLLTVTQAAEFLNVSRRQVYLLVERRELPTVRVGARIRFIPEELRLALDRHGDEGARAP